MYMVLTRMKFTVKIWSMDRSEHSLCALEPVMETPGSWWKVRQGHQEEIAFEQRSRQVKIRGEEGQRFHKRKKGPRVSENKSGVGD